MPVPASSGIFAFLHHMKVNYRDARPEDAKAILGLIKELAEYEKSPHLVENTEENLLKDGFGENPVYKAFVAEANGMVVGFALTYIRYSTWRGRVLYLEDIYVQPQSRSLGIGKELMKMSIDYARKLGLKYMVFQVLDWNTSAIQFYQRFDAEFDHEWVNVIIKTGIGQP